MITLTIGALVAVVASLTPIGKLEEMVNIGTLTAFALVSLAVPILRKRRPDLERSFKVPFNPCAADPGRAGLRLPGAEPQHRDLAAVRGLDGPRLRHLLRSTATGTAGSAGARACPAEDYSTHEAEPGSES